MIMATVPRPVFTLQQIEWLDSVFSENINPKATSEELFINLGARRVIKHIESIHAETKRNINK